MIEALPAVSQPCKVFRRWVAWGLLANRDVVSSFVQDVIRLPASVRSLLTYCDVIQASFADPPPLRLAAALLDNTQADSPFKITSNMDDFALVASAQMIQFMLSDLAAELGETVSRKAIKKISKTLDSIDSSIRTPSSPTTVGSG